METSRTRKGTGDRARTPAQEGQRRSQPRIDSRRVALEGLQRKIGNRGVQRLFERDPATSHLAGGDLHAGSHAETKRASSQIRLQGDWLENSDPARDDFWEKLRDALAVELDNYLSNIHGEAIDTWIQHMNSSGETGVGNLLVNVFKTAVGLVPGSGSIGSAIIGTVQDIYNFIDSQTPNNRMGFNDFVTHQARAHTSFSESITDRSHSVFDAVEELRNEETDENRAAKRQQALNEARSGHSRLPSFDTVYRGLVESWVRGAQDSWDTGDWGPEEAGYIYATCDYFHGSSGFANFSAFVDDVERPEGVVATIRQGWSPRVNLDELPFAMTVTVSEKRDTGTQRGFRSTGTTKFQKQVGDTSLTFVEGSEVLFRQYQSMSRRINAANLTTD